jgi:hypothetical protein
MDLDYIFELDTKSKKAKKSGEQPSVPTSPIASNEPEPKQHVVSQKSKQSPLALTAKQKRSTKSP